MYELGNIGVKSPTVRDGSKKKRDPSQLPKINDIAKIFLNLSKVRSIIKNGVSQISH